MPSEVVDGYEGIFTFEDSWAAIGKRDGKHHFYTSGRYVDMHFITPTLFVNREFQAEKEMLKDANGAVVGYSRSVNDTKFSDAIKINDVGNTELPNQFYVEITWYLFEIKQYDLALKYFERAIKLYPEDLNLKMNMAHTFLFKGEVNRAKEIYKAHLNETIREGLTWKDSLQSDFGYFVLNGYDTSTLNALMEELNLKSSK